MGLDDTDGNDRAHAPSSRDNAPSFYDIDVPRGLAQRSSITMAAYAAKPAGSRSFSLSANEHYILMKGGSVARFPAVAFWLGTSNAMPRFAAVNRPFKRIGAGPVS